MTDYRVDPNTLAALLENRLAPAERSVVISQLNASPEDAAIFADAAALLGELQAAPVTVTPLRVSRWHGWRVYMPLAAAAILAAIIIVRPLQTGDDSVQQLLALSDAPARTGDDALAQNLGADWASPGWSVSRGRTATITTTAREFRIGARVAALESALAHGDATATTQIGSELVTLLEESPGAAAVAASFKSLAHSPSPDIATRTAALADLAALYGNSPWLQLGLWAEQARIAALSNDAAFFDDDALRAFSRIAAQLRDTAVAAHTADVGEAALRAPTDMTTLRAALTSLMRAAGG